jgi:hypothetical protein
MTDSNTPQDGRGRDGRFAPGKSGNPSTQWGAGNPPPRSPGRPKRDAWVGALERMIDADGRLAEAIAARIAKIALKGKDSDALKAMDMMQDRLGGGLVRKVEAEVQVVPHTIELIDRRRSPRDKLAGSEESHDG